MCSAVLCRVRPLLVLVAEHLQVVPRAGGHARGRAAGGVAPRGGRAHVVDAHARRGRRYRLSAVSPGYYITYINGAGASTTIYLSVRHKVGTRRSAPSGRGGKDIVCDD